jgi:hypothetical protein
MIQRAELAALTPAKRAQVIFAEAQSSLSNRLWRAALGDTDRNDRDASPLGGSDMKMDSLLELLGNRLPSGVAGTHGCACQCACNCHGAKPAVGDALSDEGGRRGGKGEDAPSAAPSPAGNIPASGNPGGNGLALGANARYASALAAAEARTGLPAPTIAAIVDAEAAKTSDGRWNPHSRNPRSSAAGLGQFLSGTWTDLAQTPGTWLNAHAAERGWLDGRGRLSTGNRAELLALRYDPQASILSIADFAKLNLERLEKCGVRVRTDAETLAKAAYLSHHLGLGDAQKFLRGGIEPGRARMLLSAQIGSTAAEQRIASAGGATHAHRQWLLGFIDRRIRPEQFAG